MPEPIKYDLKVGDRFGTRVVTAVYKVGKLRRCDLVCDCGATKSTTVSAFMKAPTDCIKCSAHTKKHGLSKTKEYRSWCAMTNRCLHPSASDYSRYGGKGVTVCERWQGENGFENFLADMGPKPTPTHSIERIDHKGNYEPGNCKWATATEQARNKSNNRMITFRGVTKPMAAWSEEYNIDESALRYRLDALWDVEMALTTPSKRK